MLRAIGKAKMESRNFHARNRAVKAYERAVSDLQRATLSNDSFVTELDSAQWIARRAVMYIEGELP